MHTSLASVQPISHQQIHEYSNMIDPSRYYELYIFFEWEPKKYAFWKGGRIYIITCIYIIEFWIWPCSTKLVHFIRWKSRNTVFFLFVYPFPCCHATTPAPRAQNPPGPHRWHHGGRDRPSSCLFNEGWLLIDQNYGSPVDWRWSWISQPFLFKDWVNLFVHPFGASPVFVSKVNKYCEHDPGI